METRLSNVTEARNTGTEKLMDDFKTVIQRAEQVALDRAKAADKVIRDHPYQTIGIVFGLGVLAGWLLWRK